MNKNISTIIFLTIASAIPISTFATEKEYVIDFSANTADLPTSYPKVDSEMPLQFNLESGLVFGIENQGVRYNSNKGYDCLQISNANSGAKMYGCFSITAPYDSMITFVDFVGLDPEDTRNCRDLISGPYDNPEESGADVMKEAWSDETGMNKVYFRYGYNPAAVSSAFIKRIILKVNTEGEINDPGEEDPITDPKDPGTDPDPGTETPNPDPDPNETDSPVILNNPVAGVLSHTFLPGQDVPFRIAENETFTVGIYEYDNKTSDYLYHNLDMPACSIVVKDENGVDVSDRFDITTKQDAYYRLSSNDAGKYDIMIIWPDSKEYASGEARMTCEIYMPVIMDNFNRNIEIKVIGDGSEILSPEFDVFRESYVLLDPRNDKTENMLIHVSVGNNQECELYYSVEELHNSLVNENYNIRTYSDLTHSDLKPIGDETIMLPGKKGIITLAIKKNNVFSPMERCYYAESLKALTGENVGIEALINNNGNDVILYDMSGKRVSVKNAKGIVLRRKENGSSCVEMKL